MTTLLIALCIVLVPQISYAVNMDVIKQIESGGNANAYNKVSKARGIYQITPVVLDEFNTFNKSNYKPVDLFIPRVNEKIAYWYMEKRIPSLLKHFKVAVNTKNQIIAYNAGIRHARNGFIPKETRKYLKKYYKLGGK